MDAVREERFWSKVDRGGADECWLWVGGRLDISGYGIFFLRKMRGLKPKKESRPAHCIAYWLANGPIDSSLEIDHLCRNRACVNPAHLEAVTHKENMRRGFWAIKTHCPSGHEYTPENTIVHNGTKKRSRHCKTCSNTRRVKLRARLKAAATDEGRSLHRLRATPDNASTAQVAAVPAWHQDDHHLARVEEHRGQYRAHCSCLKAISHPLPSFAACEAFIVVHAEIEASLAAMAGGR